MRAFGVSLGVLAAAAAVALVPGGGTEAVADTQVDSISVTNGPSQGTTGGTLLTAGVTYRLVVTGTTMRALAPDHFSEDAFYCFDSTGGNCDPPFPSGEALRFGLRAKGASEPSASGLKAIDSFGDGDGTNPAYDGGHRYEQTFTPSVDSYLYAMTWPGVNPGEGDTYSGAYAVAITRVASSGGGGVDCTGTAGSVDTAPAPPSLDCQSKFGVTQLFKPPVPGTAARIESPTIPKSAKKLTLKVGLTGGAIPTPVAATTPMRVSGNDLVIMCVYYGLLGIHQDEIHLPRGKDTDFSNLGVAVFIACVKLLGDEAGKVSVHASADPCHVTFVPLLPRGTKLSAAKRRRAIAAAKRQARPSCRAASGGLSLSLAARGKGRSMRSLVGSRARVGLVRVPKAGVDPAGSGISLRWGH